MSSRRTAPRGGWCGGTVPTMRSAALLAAVAMTMAPSRTLAFPPPTRLARPPPNYPSGGSGSDAPRRTTGLPASSAAATVAELQGGQPPIVIPNLAVSLDRPLLSPIEYAYRPPSRGVWPSFLAVLLSDVCKTALVAFLLAVGVALAPKLMKRLGGEGGGVARAWGELPSRLAAGVKNMASSIAEPLRKILPSRARQKEAYTAPMPFDGDGGWGKCTLRSKKSVGSFTVCEFGLPKSYYTLPLTLGQQLDLCCLSADDDICTGSFYPFHDEEGDRAGSVKVVLNDDKDADDGGSKFMDVLRDELRPGDEVALRPGRPRLTYSGSHVPVTNVVYLSSGLGIVPVVDQVRTLAPRGSSSVKSSSVVWMNGARDDFDLAMDRLEGEYLKHPSRLAVSCILLDDATTTTGNPMEGNEEVDEAVPFFELGTMAVVSGPKAFADAARGYLTRRGYPEDCVCVLP